jgi:hypothetical protein
MMYTLSTTQLSFFSINLSTFSIQARVEASVATALAALFALTAFLSAWCAFNFSSPSSTTTYTLVTNAMVETLHTAEGS